MVVCDRFCCVRIRVDGQNAPCLSYAGPGDGHFLMDTPRPAIISGAVFLDWSHGEWIVAWRLLPVPRPGIQTAFFSGRKFQTYDLGRGGSKAFSLGSLLGKASNLLVRAGDLVRCLPVVPLASGWSTSFMEKAPLA